MLNKTTDINNSINPINNEPKETKVDGTEKYLVSLNNEITIIAYIIPITISTIPGIPR